jgi:hypothetical protein
MQVDKTKPGLIFPSQRYTKAYQEQILAEAGARCFHVVKGSWRNLFRGVRVIREGDTVFIFSLALVPTSKGKDKLSPSAQAPAFMYEAREARVVVVEAWTGRTSKRHFDDMIADAVKVLREGGGRRAAKGFRKRGRKSKRPPDDVIKNLRVIWRSREYKNDNERAAAVSEVSGQTLHKSTWRRFLEKKT